LADFVQVGLIAIMIVKTGNAALCRGQVYEQDGS
jgi:hypothetical protein